MQILSPRTESLPEIANLLDDLQSAEFCQDFEKFIRTFNLLDWDTTINPDFSQFEVFTQGLLFRFAGYFLAHYGRAEKLPHYQERGKDMFTRAIEVFETLGKKELSLETQIRMSTAYFFESGLTEAEIIQKISEEEIEDPKGRLYLLLQVNSLAVLGKKNNKNNRQDLEKVLDLEKLIDKCNDLKIKTQFYIEAGIVFRKHNQPQKAEECLILAINFSRIIKAPLREALALNSLAMLQLKNKNYPVALDKANESLELLEELGHKGWIPHILDTIAQIYFEKKEFDSAYKFIREATFKFRDSDDHLGLCDALCLEVKICFRIEMRTWAIERMVECLEIAEVKIGEEKAKYYKNEFARELHVTIGETFDEKMENYQRYLLEEAFRQTPSYAGAAKILGFESSSRLWTMVNTHYPQMIEQFGINTTKTKPSPQTLEITKITPSGDFVFGFETNYDFIYFEIPETYGLGTKIAVAQTSNINPGSLIVYQDKKIELGRLVIINGRWLVEEFFSKEKIDANSPIIFGEVIAVSSANNIFKKLE